MGINAGRLRHKVTICRYIEADDGLGGTVNKLAPLKTVYAEMRPTRGREYLEYFKEQHELTYKCTMRYQKDLRETDVLMFKGRQFLIASNINVLEIGYYQEVICTERREKSRQEAEDYGKV